MKKVSRLTKKMSTRENPQMIMETPDFFVFNKPSGWTVNTANSDQTVVVYEKPVNIEKPSLDVPFQNYVGTFLKHYRPEIHLNDIFNVVIRKDFFTTGPILIAKVPEDVIPLRLALSKKQNGKENSIKIYTCLVYGIPEKTQGTINKPIKCITKESDLKFRYQVCKADDPEGSEALSTYCVEKTFTGGTSNGSYSLVHVRIFTGRTHQVRVHMESIGHPLVHDDKYATEEDLLYSESDGFRRFFLHNSFLEFIYKKKRTSLRSNVPNTFVNAIKYNLREVQTLEHTIETLM